MLHKISQLCDKIDSLKKSADHLRYLKYGENKAPRIEIDDTYCHDTSGMSIDCKR